MSHELADRLAVAAGWTNATEVAAKYIASAFRSAAEAAKGGDRG